MRKLSQVAGSSLNWNGGVAVEGMAQALPFEQAPPLVPVCVRTGREGCR